MKNFKTSNTQSSRILFFGRSECEYSKSLLNILNSKGFIVKEVMSQKRGEKLTEDICGWSGEYIISFRSLFFLPKSLIDRAKIAAVNFHPGPPEYPGSGCINYALYDGVEEYGVTAHIMNEKIDNGNIIEVRRFRVNADDDLTSLLSKTHKELHKLCSDFIELMSVNSKNFIHQKISSAKHEKWNGNASLISDLDKLQIINLEITKKELERVIRATYTDAYPPKIELHGYDFYLSLKK